MGSLMEDAGGLCADGEPQGFLTGLSLQAVEDLLEFLDLEKSSCCMGLSQVSCPCRKAPCGRPGPTAGPLLLLSLLALPRLTSRVS